MTDKAKQLGNEPVNPVPDYSIGLTKREYFAAMAMQGLVTDQNILSRVCDIAEKDGEYISVEDVCSFQSVVYADALLEELSKTE
jgi:hypothetical protein